MATSRLVRCLRKASQSFERRADTSNHWSMLQQVSPLSAANSRTDCCTKVPGVSTRLRQQKHLVSRRPADRPNLFTVNVALHEIVTVGMTKAWTESRTHALPTTPAPPRPKKDSFGLSASNAVRPGWIRHRGGGYQIKAPEPYIS